MTLKAAIGKWNTPTKPYAVDENSTEEFCNNPRANLAKAEKTWVTQENSIAQTIRENTDHNSKELFKR